jgi:hypothetical protein
MDFIQSHPFPYMKPADPKAALIQWGIELETRLPQASNVPVGNYHAGHPVTTGITLAGARSNAPAFNADTWKAERDGSIRCDAGQIPCEFVSPILHGERGVEHLIGFVEWLNAIGATVDRSCGCHITVGIESIIGTSDTKAVSEFIRKLAHIAPRLCRHGEH